MRLLIAALTWIVGATVSIPAAAAIVALSMLAGVESGSNGPGLPEPSILIAWLGFLYGPVICLLCVPFAASILASKPDLRTRPNVFIAKAGGLFLVLAGLGSVIFHLNAAASR